MKIGENVRVIRILKGFSQSYMAKKLHISQEGYSYVENRQKVIGIEMITKIAKLLCVTIVEIENFNPNISFNQSNNDNVICDLGYSINYSEEEFNLIKSLLESKDQIIFLKEKIIIDKEILIRLLEESITLLKKE
jgi:transcriptional regulator with XRE-family HTH domain